MVVLHGACSGIKGMPRHGSASVIPASTALATTCGSHSSQSAAPMLAPDTAEGYVSTDNSTLAARIKHNVCCIPAHFVLDCSHPMEEALSPPASACDTGTKFLPSQTCMCFIVEKRLPQGYQLEMQQCSRRLNNRVLQCYCVWSRPALATSVPSTEDSCTDCYTFSAGAMIDWILYNKKSRQLHAQSLDHRVGMCCCHAGAEMSL